MELDILETELLPSDVLRIRFYRPPNMKVLSGQWIRFTCTSLAPEVKDTEKELEGLWAFVGGLELLD